MAILNIVKEGDPTLRKTSRPVDLITPRILTLIEDMVETMHKADGCGLAAVQVGVLRRIVVIEVEEGKIFRMINPEIVKKSGRQEEAEGCLSLPGKCGITSRPEKVTVRYTDPSGDGYELTGSGLLARAICHECDHLDGKLFTDAGVYLRDMKEDEE